MILALMLNADSFLYVRKHSQVWLAPPQTDSDRHVTFFSLSLHDYGAFSGSLIGSTEYSAGKSYRSNTTAIRRPPRLRRIDSDVSCSYEQRHTGLCRGR